VSLFDLTGRTALVTGASRGIGREIALGLAAAGADVALSARDEGKLREVATAVEGLGRKAVVLPADVTDADACRQLAADAVQQLGASTSGQQRRRLVLHGAVHRACASPAGRRSCASTSTRSCT
jgi:NAD(P)-dependent dehydrogenase (short-subunit alcohol dehydrogenase family)